MVFERVTAAPSDRQIDLCTSWPRKLKPSSFDKPPTLHRPSPFHRILFPLLFRLVGCPTGTSLPPCECVASSSDSPPINRYSTLSCALTFPDVNVLLCILVVSRWCGFSGSTDRIYSSRVYSCWFLMHVLRITCPCGWSGCVALFSFNVFCLLRYPCLISPPFFSPPHPTMVITVWIFVFGLSGVGLIVHLCAALAVSSICHIQCTSMQFSDGVEKKFKHFILNSHNLKLLFQRWRDEK